MIDITYYDGESGEIISTATLSNVQEAIDYKPDGAQILEGVRGTAKQEYVYNGKLQAKQSMGAQLSGPEIAINEEVSISNIPTGARVYFTGGMEIVDDGLIEWSSDVPGRFLLLVVHPMYLEEEFYIEVVA